MSTGSTKAEYDIRYAKENLKRIPLNVRKDEYELIKEAAEARGESVSRFIKEAIKERMEKPLD